MLDTPHPAPELSAEPQQRQRKIIRIDMDAFYASVEQRDDPTLRGNPNTASDPSMPRNAVTGARYKGINTPVLGMSPLAFSSGDPRWATYKQSAERGWQVRRGERGTTACKASPSTDARLGRKPPAIRSGLGPRRQ